MRHLITTDIHGQYDELMIALENARYDETTDRLIVLGDCIDRGRQSREVLDYLAGLMARGRDIELIRGNHEDILQAFLEGRPAALKGWLETCQGMTLLHSYRYDPARLRFAGDRVWADGEEIVSAEDATSVPAGGHAGSAPGRDRGDAPLPPGDPARTVATGTCFCATRG